MDRNGLGPALLQAQPLLGVAWEGHALGVDTAAVSEGTAAGHGQLTTRLTVALTPV